MNIRTLLITVESRGLQTENTFPLSLTGHSVTRIQQVCLCLCLSLGNNLETSALDCDNYFTSSGSKTYVADI